jgi:hypothetical protein
MLIDLAVTYQDIIVMSLMAFHVLVAITYLSVINEDSFGQRLVLRNRNLNPPDKTPPILLIKDTGTRASGHLFNLWKQHVIVDYERK